MRMRRKKWAVPELEASQLYIKDPASFRGWWQRAFVQTQPLYLELGCGKGGFASQFALANPGKNLLAVDISSNMLGVAAARSTPHFPRRGKRRAMCGWQPMTLSALEKFCQNRIR